MTDKTKDAFESADYYTVYKDAETFVAESPIEAILNYVEDGGEPGRSLVVYAHKRVRVDPGWPEEESAKIAETLSEDYDDEYGGGDEPIIDGDRISEFRTIVSILIGHIVHRCPPWRCDPVGQRTYSPEEVAKILEGQN